ncbi:MAG: hypothetical protein EOO27_45975, partial [Comamonadaceae bacterium]
TATDAAGNIGPATTIAVTDLAAPLAPTLLVRDTDGDGLLNITGTAEANSVVTITDPSGATHTTMTDGAGNYTLEIAAPSPLTGTYTATSTDEAGNVSPVTTAVFNDLTAPPAPTLLVRDTDGDGLPDITGTAEANSLVTVTDPSGATHTTMTDGAGNYALEIAAPGPLTGNYTATATDEAGNVSPITTAVITDLVAPPAPTLVVRDTDGDGLPNLSGTAEANSVVTITDPSGATHTTTTDGAGNYALEIAAPSPLTGNYTATATDVAGNVSPVTTVAVADLTAPPAPTLLVRETDGDGRPNLAGTAEANSLVTITDPSGATHTTTANGAGNYSLEIAAPSPLLGNYTATATDAAGNVSPLTTTAVTDLTAPPAPTLVVRDTDSDGLPNITG